MHIHRIKNDEGEWSEGDTNVDNIKCDYFHEIIIGNDKVIPEDILHFIPKIINDDQNRMLQPLPTMDELKEVVLGKNPNSASGPDDMNDHCYHVCYNIIKQDLLEVVHSFLYSQ